jgi:hypothetical protein
MSLTSRIAAAPPESQNVYRLNVCRAQIVALQLSARMTLRGGVS